VRGKNAFPAPCALEIVLDENNRDGHIANGNGETINTFAARFATFAPKLTNFSIVGGNEADQSLEAAVMDICMDRI
jgi:hypothetical protein